MPPTGPRPLPQDGPDSVGLAKGLAIAIAKLRENNADGFRTNINAVKTDKARAHSLRCINGLVSRFLLTSRITLLPAPAVAELHSNSYHRCFLYSWVSHVPVSIELPLVSSVNFPGSARPWRNSQSPKGSSSPRPLRRVSVLRRCRFCVRGPAANARKGAHQPYTSGSRLGARRFT